MPEFFLELLSEEAPAFLQAVFAERLCSMVERINFHTDVNATGTYYYTPRRMAVYLPVADEIPGKQIEARGPRESAPGTALVGFLRKTDANREDVVVENGYFVLRKNQPAQPIQRYILENLPGWLTNFPWPKSMRWGQSGDLTWIRPLRRILCLLDGQVLPIKFGPLTASDLSEGHFGMGSAPLKISSAANWKQTLSDNFVMVDPVERRSTISGGLSKAAAQCGLTIVEDEILLEEVNNLVEWPVPLIGKIDAEFMELPPEVRELSMKTNQKYFALRDAGGKPAPYFAFVANLQASDGGAAIIAGNERVLRARLSDARHFWQLDLKTPLHELMPKLEKITFHAKIGTQRERADRISALAEKISVLLVPVEDDSSDEIATWAGFLAKADLVTGMVGEFPELQGIMGGYYAALEYGEAVGAAIRTHYQPKGPSDEVPTGTAAVSVALADKLDTLREFFRIGEKPTGSGDPYALRRAALGVIRIILENGLTLPLKQFLGRDVTLFDFIIARLRVKLRGEGKRFDVLDSVLAAGADDDLLRLIKRAEALETMLITEDGKNLLVAYKRAASILKIEEAKNDWIGGVLQTHLLVEAAEAVLWKELGLVQSAIFNPGEGVCDGLFATERYEDAMQKLASLRPAIDRFLDNVTVNAESPDLRRNRLLLLAIFRDAVNKIADFSKLEG